MTPRAIARTFALAATVLAVSLPPPAAADEPPQSPGAAGGQPGRAHSLAISVGAELLTPQSLGTRTATMTPNDPAATPSPYFTVAGTRASAPAFRGRIGYHITSMISIEGGFVASRGNLEAAVSGDAESAAPLTVTERMSQYFVDVSVLAHLRHIAFASGAGVPFLEGGAGYLRQVHQDNAAIDTGQIYHFGGGVTYMFSIRPASRLKGLGLRADARVYLPRKGYSFTAAQQVFAGAGASLVIAF